MPVGKYIRTNWHRKRTSETHWNTSGKNNPMYGIRIPWTEERRKKQEQAWLRRGYKVIEKELVKKRSNQAYKRRVRMGGKLSIRRVQLIYEDNIKKYGTLTCYLCLKSILFGKDCLEHKIPLSRGGTNKYENLAIACRKCNSEKHNMTENEFKLKKGEKYYAL